MRLERDRAEGPVIAGLSERGFRIDDNVYRALLITPTRAEGWAPPPIGELSPGHLAEITGLDPRPEFLLLGTGRALLRPSPRLAEALGIGIEAMDSRAAARAWGVLRAEQRWIVAALYPLD